MQLPTWAYKTAVTAQLMVTAIGSAFANNTTEVNAAADQAFADNWKKIENTQGKTGTDPKDLDKDGKVEAHEHRYLVMQEKYAEGEISEKQWKQIQKNYENKQKQDEKAERGGGGTISLNEALNKAKGVTKTLRDLGINGENVKKADQTIKTVENTKRNIENIFKGRQ